MNELNVVYIVNYEEKQGGEVTHGVFEFCFESEDKAREEMVRDVNNRACDCGGKERVEEDWAEVTCDNGDSFRWHLGKLPIYERT